MPELPHHRVRVHTRLQALDLHLELDLHAPWTVLFGPSGSGKSTLLRAICGLLPQAHLKLERLQQGAFVDLSGLAPNHRRLAYASQAPALFPHLDVHQNVSFPSNICREAPRDATIINDALTLFRLHALGDRNPRDLSGGERQRVALARAFATPNTRLMLLDEPFTGLDRKLRDDLLPRMLADLRARHIPCLSVTHDVDEALLLQAEVIRLDAGHVLAHGPAADVLAGDRERLLRALGGDPTAPASRHPR